MSLVSYIVLALAFGIGAMLLFRRCGEATPVQLMPGLGIVATLAAIHAALYWLGALVGSYLAFYTPEEPDRYNDLNSYVFLGLAAVVAFKMLAPYLRREPQLPIFNLADKLAVLSMAVATGVNVLLVGVGTGFVEPEPNVHKIIWPLLITSILLGYLGLMFGRQKVDLRPRRWMIIACVLLLGVAMAAVINA